MGYYAGYYDSETRASPRSGEEKMSCETCVFYEDNEHFGICWYDAANPKEITQPEAECEYEAEKK